MWKLNRKCIDLAASNTQNCFAINKKNCVIAQSLVTKCPKTKKKLVIGVRSHVTNMHARCSEKKNWNENKHTERDQTNYNENEETANK